LLELVYTVFEFFVTFSSQKTGEKIGRKLININLLI